MRLHTKYGTKVLWRHPDVVKRGLKTIPYGTELSTGTLIEAFSDAIFSAAFNSNSLVDSIINGVPAFAGDRGTMAWEMCSKIIPKKESDFVRYDRDRWADRLAHTQWTLGEIRSGFPLKPIMGMK